MPLFHLPAHLIYSSQPFISPNRRERWYPRSASSYRPPRCLLTCFSPTLQTRIVSGRRFVRWEVVPPLLHQHSKYISGLPLEFFFNKTSHATDVNQLHAHPLNINILSWKKGTIEDILDRVKDGRIRILDRPQGQSTIIRSPLPFLSAPVKSDRQISFFI